LVFIDETAVATNLVRLCGRSVRGERLPAQFGHWKTHTFIAGLHCDRLTAPWIVDEKVDRTAFADLGRQPDRPGLPVRDRHAPRQAEVCFLLAFGLSYAEIAE
jgi:hypothetical protein